MPHTVGVLDDHVLSQLQQTWPRPSAPRPIVVIGAGSIVRDAHLPVYARLGFPVAGIFDIDVEAAKVRASEFSVPVAFGSLDDALAIEGAIFDLAIPPGAVADVVERLPVGAAALIQKPLGCDLPQAKHIVEICRARRLIAGVNFQLRFAPNMLALGDAVRSGVLGALRDIEVRINLHTP